MIIAGTGHRPEECEDEPVVRIKIQQKLKTVNPEFVFTGMAAGFDLYLGDECIALEIPYEAAVPWKGHKARQGDEELYQRVLDGARKVHYVNDSVDFPGNFVYHQRNEFMIDRATHVMAYMNPWASRGGTFSAVQYAKKTGKPVTNIWHLPPF